MDGLDELIDAGRPRLDKETHGDLREDPALFKEGGPSIFLFHQHDMLGQQAREYAARGDEWIWLYDAKLRK